MPKQAQEKADARGPSRGRAGARSAARPRSPSPSRARAAARPHPVLVLGGGVSGQKAALDLVGAGLDVLLVERGSSLGGTTAQLGLMFPLHNCLLCRGEARHGPGCTRPTISPDLLDHARPESLKVWTRSSLQEVSRRPGGYRVAIRREPRYVEERRCISCDRCAQVCPQALPDAFQAGLVQRKAAYRPALRAVPDSYAIDKGPWCEGCEKCVAACPTQAISLQQAPRLEEITVSAIVLATGLSLFDPARSQEYGYGRYPNVFTGLEMERQCSADGPGEGRILRRSDGQPPTRIAWLQCVGSRDKEHDYCSAFCCGYATRQAVLARRILPSAEARIFFLDDRVFARSFSPTYDPLRRAHDIRLERCRLSVLREDPATRDLLLQVSGEDGKIREERFGLVVLSVGAQGAAGAGGLPASLGLEADPFGFVRTSSLSPVDTRLPGVFVAGAAAGPADVADSVTLGSAAAARVCGHLRWRPPAAAGGRPAAASADDSASPAPAAAQPARRIGVLACDCAGEIGGVIDLPRVLQQAAELPAVEAAQSVPFGCFPEGLARMRDLVREHRLEAVVVGACNRRTFGPLFQKGLGVDLQFVSLREECASVHRADPAGATRQAGELLSLAVANLRGGPLDAPGVPRLALAALEPTGREPRARGPLAIVPERSALVVGGGLAGLTASLHLADAGMRVHLVEKERSLGGNALRLNRSPEGADLPAAVQALAERARRHPLLTVHAPGQVLRRQGLAGRFSVTLEDRTLLRVGAVIVATGGEEFRGAVYGLGSEERVVTLLELGQRLAREPRLPARLGSVAFIGCVGPWDQPGSSQAWRCSRGCCETMMRQARALREANPEAEVAVLVREVNTYGFREEEYTAARRAGVLFVRFQPGQPPRLRPAGGVLELAVEDSSLQETLLFHPDLVVLAAAIVPRADCGATAARLDIPLDAEGFVREWEAKTRGFASLEPGVFLCGLAHGPKPLREVVPQALAAAQQALVLLSQDRLVPADTTAEVDAGRCASCLTCLRVCPYGVPRLEEAEANHGRVRRRSVIDPFRCQGCGTCAGECPAGAIQLRRHGGQRLLGLPGRWLSSAGGQA
jgi:heterodisulfide reductase subunit A